MSSPSDPSGAFQRSHPSEGMQALEKERKLPLTGWQQEVDQAKRLGLEAAESIVDRNISTFSRGELPHFAGINTFMKAPYLEDVNQVSNYDVAIVGVPHDDVDPIEIFPQTKSINLNNSKKKRLINFTQK